HETAGANSACPCCFYPPRTTTPFGETQPPYYCRDQCGREEQGCISSSGGPSTVPRGCPTPAPTPATPPRPPPAQRSSPARSVSSASCRLGWERLVRPSAGRSASPSTERSWPKSITPGTAVPSPPTRGTLPTISCDCATMPSKPDGNRPPKQKTTLTIRVSTPWPQSKTS